MYFLFINSGDKCDIYFFVQFNNNNSNKKIFKPMGSTRPNSTHVGWVELDLCDGLDLVEFFLTHHSGLGQKILSTRPNPTHTHPYFLLCE